MQEKQIDNLETIESLLQTRQEMYDLILQSYHNFQKVHALAKRYKGYVSMDEIGRIFSSYSDSDRATACARGLVDRLFWNWILNSTVFASFLSTETRSQIKKDVDVSIWDLHKVPELNANTINQVMSANPREEYNKTIVGLFNRLSRHHKTNSGFCFGEKFIFSCVFSYDWSTSLSQYSSEILHEIDKAVSIAEKRQPPTHWSQGGLVQAVSKTRKDGERDGETESISYKVFKNGNLHIKIKNQDTIDRLNLVLTKALGANALGYSKNI